MSDQNMGYCLKCGAYVTHRCQPNQPQVPMSAETYFNQMYNRPIYTIFGICKFAEAYAAYRGAADQQTSEKKLSDACDLWTEENNKHVQTIAELQAQVKVLLDALQPLVWKERDQFPHNPYCVLCGTGRVWANKHGHEPTCPLEGKDGTK